MTRNILLVTGVSASGKDYLLERAKQFEPRIGSDVPVVNMGEALTSKLNQERNEISRVSRDRMKHMVSNDVMKGYVTSIISELVEFQSLIINGHITYRQQGVLTSNPEIDTVINPAAYAVVVADPKNIVEWRRSDPLRNRDTESSDEIARHQDFTVQTAEKMATTLGIACRIVENIPNHTDTAARSIAILATELCDR